MDNLCSSKESPSKGEFTLSWIDHSGVMLTMRCSWQREEFGEWGSVLKSSEGKLLLYFFLAHPRRSPQEPPQPNHSLVCPPAFWFPRQCQPGHYSMLPCHLPNFYSATFSCDSKAPSTPVMILEGVCSLREPGWTSSAITSVASPSLSLGERGLYIHWQRDHLLFFFLDDL